MAIALCAIPVPALAQASAPPAAQAAKTTPPAQSSATPASPANEIIVYASRFVDEIQAPQPPLLELNTEDIAAYGATSIADLISQLGSTVTTGRGSRGSGFPVILVNGLRISSFRELRTYPPEAIEKVQVFPEDVAEQYGYSPDQRVVNIILKKHFRSIQGVLEYGQPTAGGYSTHMAEGTYLKINGPSRLNFDVQASNSSMLTDAERGVIQSVVPSLASDPNPADFRSLVPDSSTLQGTANWTVALGPGNSLSINATVERDTTLKLQGLDTVTLTDPNGNSLLRTLDAAHPLTVDNHTETYSSGATLNLGLGDWHLTGTVDANHSFSRDRIERQADTSALVAAAAAGQLSISGPLPTLPDPGFDQALTTTNTVDSLLTARDRLIELPAGNVTVTLKGGFNYSDIHSTDTRNSGIETALNRSTFSTGANLSIPLTARHQFLGAAGDFTLDLNAGVDHVSSFGTLYNVNTGLVWNVTDTVTFSGTYIRRDAAPSLTQLGAAQVATPNVPIFDIRNNRTVLATVISGGNPDLSAENESDWKYSFQWRLPFFDRARFSIDYLNNHSTNVSAGFPLLTPAIEAAFPGRVTRNSAGQLVQVDERPVLFAAQDERQLQIGFNASGRIGGSHRFGGGSGGGDEAPEQHPRPRPPQEAGASGEQGAGPPAGGNYLNRHFDPQRFAAMRAKFCAADSATVIARMNQELADQASGKTPPKDGAGGQSAPAMPQRLLQRLEGPDGKIDPVKFAAFRQRICSGDGTAFAHRPGSGSAAGSTGGAPVAAAENDNGRGGGPSHRGEGRHPPFFGNRNGGRWFANLQYNIELANTVLIAPGLPRLDLLNGDSLSDSGSPRSNLEFRLGGFYNGFGMRWRVKYTGPSTVNGSGLPGSTDLHFAGRTQVDLRMFADLGRQQKLVEAMPFLKGARVAVSFNNLFDARQQVTDANGNTPLRYQPYLIDPTGRSVKIVLRKLF